MRCQAQSKAASRWASPEQPTMNKPLEAPRMGTGACGCAVLRCLCKAPCVGECLRLCGWRGCLGDWVVGLGCFYYWLPGLHRWILTC